MMGRQTGDQSQLFCLFNLEDRIPACHLPAMLLCRKIGPTKGPVYVAVSQGCYCRAFN